MGRPPIKSTKALTMARVQGELEATRRWKATQAGIASSARDHIGRMIDKIDPVELLGVVGTSLIIYDLLKSTPEFYTAVKTDVAQAWADLFEPLGWEIEVWKLLTGSTTEIKLTPDQEAAFEKTKNEIDYVLMLKSFGLATILIRNGQAITNLATYVGSALGLVAVA